MGLVRGQSGQEAKKRCVKRAQAAEEPAALELRRVPWSKNAPEPAQGSGAGHSGEKPAGRGDADGGEKLALQNPALVVCEKDGEQVLLKVRPDRRENFRPHLTAGRR